MHVPPADRASQVQVSRLTATSVRSLLIATRLLISVTISSFLSFLSFHFFVMFIRFPFSWCPFPKEFVSVWQISPQFTPTLYRGFPPNACLSPRLCINIGVTEGLDITPYMSDVNRFIETLRKRKRNVLVHCYHGSNRGPAFVIQYLMCVSMMLV